MPVYSLDLRKRVVSAYKVGNISIRKLAEQFQVTKRTVHRWIKQHRETGDLTPLKAGTKKSSCLEPQKQHILQMVAENPDWTLREYCEELGEKTGVYVSQATMCLFLKREEQTLKKNLS